MSYYEGDRKKGFVRLVACEVCGESKRITVQERGPIARSCEECRGPKWKGRCTHCNRPVVGRMKKFCSSNCKREFWNEFRRSPEGHLARWAKDLIRKRDGAVHKCVICEQPVDPRVLSRWGFREAGLYFHESAGTHPSAETIDGPSCRDWALDIGMEVD